MVDSKVNELNSLDNTSVVAEDTLTEENVILLSSEGQAVAGEATQETVELVEEQVPMTGEPAMSGLSIGVFAVALLIAFFIGAVVIKVGNKLAVSTASVGTMSSGDTGSPFLSTFTKEARRGDG